MHEDDAELLLVILEDDVHGAQLEHLLLHVAAVLVTTTRWDSTASARGRMMRVQMLWMMMTESSSALML